MKHKKTYADMERHPGDMSDFRRPAYSVRHPDTGYHDTQNTSTGQQNVAEYPESEYGTQNMSMAGKLIRAQGEQIRYMSADEYLKSKMTLNAYIGIRNMSMIRQKEHIREED